MNDKEYFQDYMPGNVCFGCGSQHPEGLRIKSFWEGDSAICIWQPDEKYHGWANLLNGGIIAALIDCHCMGTAMAYAYQQEARALDSTPIYRYATGGLNVTYMKPTSTHELVTLSAQIVSVARKKTILKCTLSSAGIITVTADVVAIRVYDSSIPQKQNSFI
ncbi:MAG: PaaI family thioesterase [Flammeovirgaceae bacterium]|jgi:acyl-coenzyme A thioesterase PaaI-like protein|nr:PaaI family thioesterase [Flammeovirgaceae bacterium]|tara:strand:+ start:13973 stop:14458 length:486 start_codon:yes stop_codon:yes gene_type:complete